MICIIPKIIQFHWRIAQAKVYSQNKDRPLPRCRFFKNCTDLWSQTFRYLEKCQYLRLAYYARRRGSCFFFFFCHFIREERLIRITLADVLLHKHCQIVYIHVLIPDGFITTISNQNCEKLDNVCKSLSWVQKHFFLPGGYRLFFKSEFKIYIIEKERESVMHYSTNQRKVSS